MSITEAIVYDPLDTRKPKLGISGLGPRFDVDLFLWPPYVSGLTGSFAYGG